ncbi:MAG: MarR family transcriptional regulator [Saprospiraceae bacterium]|nr:MarR family transcriptional regulator [Candidatus Vicinibacter proximus]MBL7822172.1 MarR family transcriptional regulator [Saprospiraceae bacterium]MCC6843308.1 MarR family transcriptional regulator [Saprospiraceae bacterium]HRG33089.1 MarR family transcriptional regulator [Saprospiraceae bacterium]
MEKIDQIVFYTLEKSIKSYRQFAQKNINKKGFDITIDQWLVLKTIESNEGMSQQQIAINVFKDYASITRIIEILVNKKFLERAFHSADRRRFDLSITKLGLEILTRLTPIIESNRKQALNGVTKSEIEFLKKVLNKITENCI